MSRFIIKCGSSNFVIKDLSGEFEVCDSAVDIITYTYDEDSETFELRIENPSARTRFLYENDWLYIVPSIKDCSYGGINNDKRYITEDGEVVNTYRRARRDPITHQLYSNWSTPGYDLNQRAVDRLYFVEDSNSIIITKDEFENRMGHSLRGILAMADSYGDPSRDTYYLDVKFNLFSAKAGRIYKTKCEPFRLEFTR